MKNLAVFTLGLFLTTAQIGTVLGAPSLALTEEESMALPKVSEQDIRWINTWEPEIFKALDVEQIRYLTAEAGLKIFSRVSEDHLGWSTLELFADPLFQERGKTYFLTREVLVAIDRVYNLHLLYEVSGHYIKDVNGQGCCAKGTPFLIKALICGNGGEFWVLYDHPVALKSSEYPALGGQFDLYRTNRILVSRDAKSRIVSILSGRNSPSESFRPLVGPLNVPVAKLVLSNEKKKVYLHLASLVAPMSIPNKSVSRRLTAP